jgi:hypothetical protein
MNHTPAPPVLGKDEMPQLQAALEGPAGRGVLAAIATVAQARRHAHAARQKGFTDTLTAMQSSKDPVKMSTANAVADKLWQQNAAQAEQALGKGSLDKLQAWQALKGSFNAEELASGSTSPTTRRLKAREEARRTPPRRRSRAVPSDMAYKLGTGWPGIGRLTGSTPAAPFDSIKGGELVADYQRHLYRAADLWRRCRQGLRPGRAAAAVDVGRLGRGRQPGHEDAGMITDGQTQAEIAQGKPPSYQVAIKRKDGTLDILPGRVGFDPADHIDKYGAKLRARQQAVEQGRASTPGCPSHERDRRRPGASFGLRTEQGGPPARAPAGTDGGEAIWGAAFRQTNSVVSALQYMRNSGSYAPQPGYNPVTDIKAWGDPKYFLDHGTSFVGSQSPAETLSIKSRSTRRRPTGARWRPAARSASWRRWAPGCSTRPCCCPAASAWTRRAAGCPSARPR